MAGKYRIPCGKKVRFRLDRGTNLYYAETDGQAFGLAQYLVKGKPVQLKQLGNTFDGCVVETDPEKRRVTVKIFLKGRKNEKRKYGAGQRPSSGKAGSIYRRK